MVVSNGFQSESPFPGVYFQGRTVRFREGKSLHCLNIAGKVNLILMLFARKDSDFPLRHVVRLPAGLKWCWDVFFDPKIWAILIATNPPRSPQMAVKSKGIPPKIPETIQV